MTQLTEEYTDSGKIVPVSETEDSDVAAFDGLNGDDYVYTDMGSILIMRKSAIIAK